MPNLPIVGNSEDTWGQDNNDFLTVSHEPSGADGGKLKTTALDGRNFTGTISLSAASEVALPPSTSIGTVSAIELGYLDGVTSAVQTQIDNKAATTHTHVLTGGATDVTATAAEINQVSDGVGVSVTAVTLTDLTSGGYDATSYHYHSTDRARANHIGTQSPSTISPQGSGSGLDADTIDLYEAIDLAKINENNIFTKSQVVALYDLGTLNGTINTDASLSNTFTVTLSGSCSMTNPTNLISGGTYIWNVDQDNSGGHSLSYDTYFKFPNGQSTTITASASAKNTLTCIYDGFILRCAIQKDFI